MAREAADSSPVAKCSGAMDEGARLKRELPSIQEAIKQEKTFPKGTSCPFIAATIAGGHCITKLYMDPSNKAWTTTKLVMCLSLQISFKPSWTLRQMPLLSSSFAELAAPVSAAAEALSSPAEATFSFQVTAATAAPPARSPAEAKKGACGPHRFATAAANWPARIAVRKSPRKATPKVSLSQELGRPKRLYSETSHASGAAANRLEATPPQNRPAKSMGRLEARVERAAKE
mmetsp:Transcript_32752/g.70236  ORF Transcript_32752/g.70236 Transcript_32752/m.70236 type:complete len:232 (-) Transcript_32752:699-1394(-)